MCQGVALSEMYCDFIIRSDEVLLEAECEVNVGDEYKIAYVKRDKAEPIRLDKYSYNSIPKCYTLLDVEAMQEAGILAVQNYPTLALDGTGVLIGFIDTGIDYRNPIFRNLDGSTRIVRIWDQTIENELLPESVPYGTEYTEEMINQALLLDEPERLVPSRDINNHGTFLAGISAGGAEEAEQFLGAAPGAFIAMVKLKEAKTYLKDFYLIETENPCYQENDIMLGAEYLHRLAEKLGLPLVLCIALGTNQGSHTGGSPLSGILDIIGTKANRAVVIGGGNEANQRHHFLGRLENGTMSVDVEVRVADGVGGFCTELWSDALDIFRISVISPSGERTYAFPVRVGRTQEYLFVFEGTKIYVDYKVFVERSNAQLVFVRVVLPTPGVWKFSVETVRTESGMFHMWLPVAEFLKNEVFFLESNPDYTITEPGSTISTITVGFYNGKDNSIAIQSGRGYTRSNRVKPDFVAPGVEIIGPISMNRFTTRTGSSVAVGIAAGGAALLLEWAVYRLEVNTIDSTQIRNLLILGTERRENEAYPNQEWGYGKLNVYQTFEVIRKI